MQMIFNISQKFIIIKDMTDVIDFGPINQEFDKLDFKDNISNHVSNEMNLFDKDIFADTKRIIEAECEDYLNNSLNMTPFYSGLRMTNSWGNITHPGSSHHDHVHPFSVVSGVIYLDNNPSNLNLFIESFIPDIPYFITRNKSYISLNSLLSDSNVDPNSVNNLKNHMVLFLSNSSHFVEKTTVDMDRRSISFNTFWKGLTGVKEEQLGSIDFKG
jgi:uncharacterized protein (TIGR02466 family)